MNYGKVLVLCSLSLVLGCRMFVGSGDSPVLVSPSTVPVSPSTVAASGESFNFGSTRLSSSTEKVITLNFTGSTPVTGVTFASIEAPFAFRGGVYPGIGGTCGTTISSSCTIVVTYTPTAVGTHSSTLTASYVDQGTARNATFQVTGKSFFACFSETDEQDDYLSAGASECDATWTNNVITSLDQRTGLMWSRPSQAGDLTSEKDGVSDGKINWYEAVGKTTSGGATCTNADHAGCNSDGESFCGKLNSLSFAGFTDWRAPGQKELMQAYIDGASYQATVFNVNHVYWGDTTESDGALWGAYFRFGYGNGADSLKNSAGYRGICVRDSGDAQILALNGCHVANEVDDYMTNGANECDATWSLQAVTGGNVSTDERTRLMWSRPSAAGDFTSEKDGVNDGAVNWFEAVGVATSGSGTCGDSDHTGCNDDGESYCGRLNNIAYGGYTNWRAPGQKEFMQAYVDGGSHLSGVFNVDLFYWAKTTESDDVLWGSYRRFGYGNGEDALKNYSAWYTDHYALCVRAIDE